MPLCYAAEADEVDDVYTFYIPDDDLDNYIQPDMSFDDWVMVDVSPSGDAATYSLGGDGFSTSTDSNTINLIHRLSLYEIYQVPTYSKSYMQTTVSAATTGTTYTNIYSNSVSSLNQDIFNSTSNYLLGYRVTIGGLANPILFDMGDSGSVIVRGLVMRARVKHGPGGNTTNLYNFHEESVQYIDLYYTDVNGERYFLKTIDNPGAVMSYNDTESTLTLRLDYGEFPDDAYSVDFELYFTAHEAFFKSDDITDGLSSVMFGWGHHKDLFDVTLKLNSGNAGFFESIFGWLQSILNAITGGFSSLIDNIVSLPSQIWSFIETGLKNLFVPSPSDLKTIKQNWDTLLSERFGALYDVVDIISGFADTFSNVSAQDSITFPTVSLELAGSKFDFGGWEVPIVPHERFQFLFDVLRQIVNIVCTCLFLNGLARRFSNMLGGVSD